MGKNAVIVGLSVALLATSLLWFRASNKQASAEQMLCGCGRVVQATRIAEGLDPEPLGFEESLCSSD